MTRLERERFTIHIAALTADRQYRIVTVGRNVVVSEQVVKLVITITREEEATHLIEALIEHEFRATRINTAGGFLKRGNSTVVVGVEDDRVVDVVGLVRQSTDHASVFVLNVARYERL